MQSIATHPWYQVKTWLVLDTSINFIGVVILTAFHRAHDRILGINPIGFVSLRHFSAREMEIFNRVLFTRGFQREASWCRNFCLEYWWRFLVAARRLFIRTRSIKNNLAPCQTWATDGRLYWGWKWLSQLAEEEQSWIYQLPLPYCFRFSWNSCKRMKNLNHSRRWVRLQLHRCYDDSIIS